ncbi:MAG: dihydropteroate synthase [Candidatus Latescibacteria bacterium]|nr:dihydropteroate synthase [Candidatus Latescibacterota bacterium]
MFDLCCNNTTLHLSRRVHVMGILNVTPDSFSDGGRFLRLDDAVRRAEEMVAEGADLIDVGGESSRPGSDPVPLDEELDRVIPVVEALAKRIPAPISVDTYKAEVARRALDAGAVLVNDISAMRFDPRMKELIAERGVPVILMHMLGTPRDMQISPSYEDVIKEISVFLRDRIAEAVSAGIARTQIVVDPGIGFGKRVADNLEIVRRLDAFHALGCPILLGPSRKSFIGKALDLPSEERLEGTAAVVALSVLRGAHLIRVHDVRQMVRVVRMVEAIERGGEEKQKSEARGQRPEVNGQKSEGGGCQLIVDR